MISSESDTDNGVRVTEGQSNVLTALLASVTYTVDLQLLGEAVCNTLNHVVDQGSCQTVEGLAEVLLVRTLNDNLVALLGDLHKVIEFLSEGALGALYCNYGAVDIYFHTCGNSNGLLTNS